MLRVPMNISFGGDPEAFFERGGKIVGSERVLTEQGLKFGFVTNVVRDGVQFELNPGNGPSPFSFGSALGKAFRDLRTHLIAFPDVKINWRTLVEVQRDELDALSENSRILGCQPSLNIYGKKEITVDPKTYQKRSAGGHFHFGLGSTAIMDSFALEDYRHRLIPHLDIFVGNQGVMLDRDPNAAERRENYGRAGEYRLPPYGVEYRVLSNFWLRHYTLYDLMAGMARIAIAVLDQSLRGDTIEQELVELVDKNGTIDNFADAINNNDYDLAKKNFQEVVRPFLVKHLPHVSPFPLASYNMDSFLTFCEGVKDHGLEYFFPKNPIDYWADDSFPDFKEFIKLH